MASEKKSGWGITLTMGVVSLALYAALFMYEKELIHFAKSTNDSCVIVEEGVSKTYIESHNPKKKLTDETGAPLPFEQACAKQGGEYHQGTLWYFLIPILIAFMFSKVHGDFTGHFWDALGFKPAKKK